MSRNHRTMLRQAAKRERYCRTLIRNARREFDPLWKASAAATPKEYPSRTTVAQPIHITPFGHTPQPLYVNTEITNSTAPVGARRRT